MEDRKSYLLHLEKPEYELLKHRANKLRLSIKELILISVYNLVENNPNIFKEHKEHKNEKNNL